MSKVVLDTNIFIDDPKIILNNNYEYIVPFTVLRELDGLKKNPDLSFAVRSAIKILYMKMKSGDVKIVDIPEDLATNDEKIIDSAKRKDCPILTNDIGARAIAMARDVEIIDNDIDEHIPIDYNGYLEHTDDLTYESYIASKVLDKELMESIIGDKIMINQYIAIHRTGGKVDVLKEQDGEIHRVSQSAKPYKAANIMITPLDHYQVMAWDSASSDVPLTILDGKVGSSKTLSALVGLLSRTIGENRRKKYRKIYISRAPTPTDRDTKLGFMPGPQPLYSKVLTPTGWTTMGELKVGDKVIGRDGNPTTITGIFPKGNKEVFKITTDTGKVAEACGDHIWQTQDYNQYKHNQDGNLRTTKEIAESITYKDTGKLNHYLPRRDPAKFDLKELPLDPYVLGALLGDGSLGSSIVLTTSDTEIIAEVNTRLKDISAGVISHKGIHATLGAIDGRANKSTGSNKVPKYTNPVKLALEPLGLLNKHFDTKFIPNDYIYGATIEQRLDLLRGLLDTDGTVNRGNAFFYTSSDHLVEGVVELVQSLGGSTYVSSRLRDEEPKGLVNGRKIIATCTSYEVGIKLPTGMVPFLLPRKADKFLSTVSKTGRNKKVKSDIIKSVELVGITEVQCIQVDNPEHLYITDNFIVTHNTMQDKSAQWILGITSNLRMLFGDAIAQELIETTFEFISLESIQGLSLQEDEAILIDEYQFLSRDILNQALTRAGNGTKVILAGDPDSQTYGVNRGNEGFKAIQKAYGNTKFFQYVKLNNIYRSPFVEYIDRLFHEDAYTNLKEIN